ncbi:MAG: hypothetical protein WC998_05625 [Candidatus Paceibacterota bacterium]|jgi:hypothetical protein
MCENKLNPPDLPKLGANQISNLVEPLVKPQKHIYESEGIGINYYATPKIIETPNKNLPIMIFILTVSILFFVAGLIMFLSV